MPEITVFQCARIEYYALSPGASTKSCAAWWRIYWRSFEAQRVMLDASALKRVVYFHISRVPRLTFFLSWGARHTVAGGASGVRRALTLVKLPTVSNTAGFAGPRVAGIILLSNTHFSSSRSVVRFVTRYYGTWMDIAARCALVIRRRAAAARGALVRTAQSGSG